MIYKYLDEKKLEPVTDRTLKFATIDDLNDPFENLPVLESREVTPEDMPLVLDKLGDMMGLPLGKVSDPKVLEDLAQTLNEKLIKPIDQNKHRFSEILNQIAVRNRSNPRSPLGFFHSQITQIAA